MKSSANISASGLTAAGASYANALLSLELAYVLTAAASSGLLARLCVSPATASEHAAALSLGEEPTATTLAALAAAGFADESDGAYRASAGLATLEARSPGGLVGFHRLWQHVPAFLHSGEPIMHADGDAREREQVYSDVVPKLAAMFEPSAAKLAKHLSSTPPKHVLDVGAGSGVWSLAVAQQVESSMVTALDLPKVIPRFVERAATLGLIERVKTLARSHTEEPLADERYDLVVVANILHLESAAHAKALVRRASNVLTDDGRLVIVDQLGGSSDADLAMRLYALHLSMRTHAGTPHPRTAIEAWLRGAGLHSVEHLPLELPGMAALIASREGGPTM